jgi:aspartate aminotransferase-like enzyme
MAHTLVHHRSPAFEPIFDEALAGLKWLYKTEGDVLVFASSGTGAMEGSVVNFLSPGDEAIVVRAGKFGERFGDICTAFGVKPVCVDVPWGESVPADAVARALDAHPAARAVYVQGCETSTAALHPFAEIARLTHARANTIIVVDGITAVGIHDVPVDALGLDVVISGSQKAFMLPPGLAFASVSKKAWRLSESAKLPRYYFDWRKERKAAGKSTTAWTPAISLIVGLREAIAMMREEGLDNVFARHERLSRATRAAVDALGLTLFTTGVPAHGLTAVAAPAGRDGAPIDARRIVRGMRERHGITIAAGQDEAEAKAFRIGHMGFVTEQDLLMALGALEDVLEDVGLAVPRGAGVTAAARVLFNRPAAQQ